MIQIEVKGRAARVVESELLTAGSVGIRAQLRLEGWDGLVAVAVCNGSGVSRDVALLEGNIIEIPPETMQRPGGHLRIGVYGNDGEDTTVVPTVWADAGLIHNGAKPSGISPEIITPSLAAQVLAAAAEAVNKAVSVVAAAAAGAFDGADGQPGQPGQPGQDGQDGQDGADAVIWYTTSTPTGRLPGETGGSFAISELSGPVGAVPAAGQMVVSNSNAGSYAYFIDALDENDQVLLRQYRVDLKGPQGPKGDKGDTGTQGPPGTNGADGSDGADAVIWYSDSAPTGENPKYLPISALVGPAGAVLAPGHMVVSGFNGMGYFISAVENPVVYLADESVRVTGMQGATGAQGPQGEKGDKGDPGATGAQGPQGSAGRSGWIWIATAISEPYGGHTYVFDTDNLIGYVSQATSPIYAGDAVLYDGYLYPVVEVSYPYNVYADTRESIRGPQGAQGAQGAQGPAGANGTNGTNGTNGADGADGTTFTPAVSSAGVISWTNDGGKQNPASVDLVAAAQAVRYAAQTLTDAQKAQARENIGAADAASLPAFEEDHAAPASGNTFAPVDLSYLLSITEGENWGWSGNRKAASGWWCVSDKIAVIPGATYRFVNFPRNMFQYGQSGTSGTAENLPVGRDVTYTIPAGVYYIGFYEALPVKSPLQLYRLTPTPEEAAALGDPNLMAEHLSLSLQNFKAAAVADPVVPLKGKKIVNFGDSIFGNFYAPEDVSSLLAQYTGAEVANCGFGGSMMSTHYNANYALFSFHALVDAIVSEDWTAQDAALESAWENPETYPARLATLKGIDFSEVDFVTVAYGTNDWNNASDLDNPLNPKDVSTYCGAFRYSIEKLLTAFPQLRIFACTPIFRTRLDANYDVIEYSDTWVNGDGKTIPDYAAALKDVCAEYCLPCVDNYWQLGVNKLNRTLYYRPNDGTHPSVAGRQRIARNIADALTAAGAGWGGRILQPGAISDMASKTWVGQQGYLTLADLPVYTGGVV